MSAPPFEAPTRLLPVETPAPPYYAVIFVARLLPVDLGEYQRRTADLMEKAKGLPGFLGEDAVSSEDGRLISVSYWKSEEDIAAWAADEEHKEAKRRGIRSWYDYYELRIAKVESANSFRAEPK